jgi:hypothetical protein
VQVQENNRKNISHSRKRDINAYKWISCKTQKPEMQCNTHRNWYVVEMIRFTKKKTTNLRSDVIFNYLAVKQALETTAKYHCAICRLYGDCH